MRKSLGKAVNEATVSRDVSGSLSENKSAKSGGVHNVTGGVVTVNSTTARSTDDVTQSTLDVVPSATDEAYIIEARRKRREAIKNRFQHQPNPLLVQALSKDAEVDSIGSTPAQVESPRSG